MKLNTVTNGGAYSIPEPKAQATKIPQVPKLLLEDLRTKAGEFQKLKAQGLIHGDPTEKEMEAKLARTIQDLEGIIQKLG